MKENNTSIKRLAVIYLSYNSGKSVKTELLEIMNHNVIIELFHPADEIKNIEKYDLILFTSDQAFDAMANFDNLNLDYVVLDRVINLDKVQEILKLPPGEKVLIVNDLKQSCQLVIDQLKRFGLEHVDYYPYYEYIDHYENLPIAITPGESHLAPNCVKKIIDIGIRRIDITDMVKIFSRLGIIDEYNHKLSPYFYKNSFVTPTKELVNNITDLNKKNELVSSILNNIKLATICIDSNKKIIAANSSALAFLQNNIDLKVNSSSVFLDNVEFFDENMISDKEYLLNINLLHLDDKTSLKIITFEKIDDVRSKEEKVRLNKKEHSNNAKYAFDDIISVSFNTKQNVELAKKISKTNSTILIQGETGTGKELYAQAIHNHSPRSANPFIAINFSAIPETLLESELFGYEAGSFTGAHKSGKEGLLKKAHKGTLFLDEIGDIPYNLQVKLLRVIQEREITPVGSTQTVPIDVRIIAATNKDLSIEVENGNFREDLFYRINVLPIYTIPLRNRKEDIFHLLNHYTHKISPFRYISDILSQDAIRFLTDYSWPGNIRELVNIVEYFTSIADIGEKLNISDIPSYILNKSNVEFKEKSILDPDSFWVLNKIYSEKNVGRKTLSISAEKECVNLSEGQIRTIMNKLKEKGLITMKRGLNGTCITSKGEEFLKN